VKRLLAVKASREMSTNMAPSAKKKSKRGIEEVAVAEGLAEDARLKKIRKNNGLEKKRVKEFERSIPGVIP